MKTQKIENNNTNAVKKHTVLVALTNEENDQLDDIVSDYGNLMSKTGLVTFLVKQALKQPIKFSMTVGE